MIITSQTIEWQEKNPREIKGWVVKSQRALLTPFRDAAALKAIATGNDVIYRKKRYDLGTSYTHKKGTI